MAKKHKNSGASVPTMASGDAAEQQLAEMLDAPAILEHIPLVTPRPKTSDQTDWRVKIPSVVCRVDGRFGVAFPSGKHSPRRCDLSGIEVRNIHAPWFQSVLGRSSFNTSMTSGFAHEDKTYNTREQAETRAWALAREIGFTEDWP
jgi:hypothetical protein